MQGHLECMARFAGKYPLSRHHERPRLIMGNLTMRFKHLKKWCAGCEQTGVQTSKEHVFPTWLITRTGTHKTGIRWLGGDKIPAHKATLPLCKRCNNDFGSQLEEPVSRIFDDLEARRGISDNEAELLVRWLWKIAGLFWIASAPLGDYSPAYTLRERVLRPIDAIRSRLVLAVSLIEAIDSSYGDKPMGLDSHTVIDAIFVAGVFSEVAIMVVFDDFTNMIPEPFSQYRLFGARNASGDAKLFHPKVGFRDDTEAVGITNLVSIRLSAVHDAHMGAVQRELEGKRGK